LECARRAVGEKANFAISEIIKSKNLQYSWRFIYFMTGG
jgi:hypothetical protein